jgi:N12 class adenine-specific DNA methylase
MRPGGIVAFITSSGTMDKKNPSVRRYLAQRAELLGAVRLPNNAFLANAGTTVVTDILFLQKRDRPIEIEPDWVHLGTTSTGLTVNQYFVDNPDMILGELTAESTQYGRQDSTVKPIEGAELADQLHDALSGLHTKFTEFAPIDDLEEADSGAIPADPNVRNFSFTIVDGEIYYRENSRMNKVDASVTAGNRIRGMIELRDCTRRLIELQLNGHSDTEIAVEQARLNELYDAFVKKYGLINSRGNNMAFSDDSSYCLLCSLEVLDEEGNLARKAEMFTKRTIRQQVGITHVDTPSEALAVSLGEKVRVDLPYMADLTGMSEEQIVADLTDVIFRDYGDLVPANIAWAFFDPAQFPMVTADEYLSGNVREKLRQVRQLREMLSGHGVDASVLSQVDSSIAALEKAQPTELTASEIDVRLSSTWVPPEIIEEFMYELFQTGGWARSRMHVQFSGYTANWTVTNKSSDYGSVPATVTYGTSRASGYRILEDTLNLRDVRIFDTVRDADGKEQRVLNKKETVLAQQKQQLIKEAFTQWIWKDAARREQLTALYNERFNSTRPREYDGSHIRFVGMNPEIMLRPHQADSVARMLYGGNALLAHVVGAGKTFAMAAAAMELKRLGLCQKSLFVVPNHLTEQWAAEFLQLYPSANILVATRRDFEKTRRRTFCSRIATGDYDAIIIGHSQFEKIPMSLDRQRAQLQEQLDEVLDGIAEAKSARAERFTIKQMERARKSIKLKLDKLNNTERKDDVITFEELGVDRLFVDEAHGFKNLAVFTKMRNVAGISQTEAQKSADLFMKCHYMDELTGGRGVVFATGTPVSNSMTELYTMQRYLQYGTLRRNGLQHFDAWASTFGETVTSIELAPEGTGYRARTRFARFFNLPELIAMFKEVADIKTADMLRLPVPEVEYHNIRLEPSEIQRELVAGLAERAERVRNQMVDPSVDNMLTITNDGRKLALDQRLLNPALPDDPNSKVGACLGNVFHIWSESQVERFTQLVFCDLSTPKGDREFSVYDDLKKKLIELGVPTEEIAFIHDANTETKKAELFAKVRAGQVRILLGSTAKMGSGTNVQRVLYAEHHLDIPWRPADLEQREGRAIRQGNTCSAVHIYRYVTEGTFDAYMWATLENKQKFIGQIMTSKSPVRSCEDVDETALTYAEVKALATGDERIKEKMDLEVDVAKLKLVRANYLTQTYALEDALLKHFPQEIRRTQDRIAGYLSDIERFAAQVGDEFPSMELCGIVFAEKKDAGAALLAACKAQTSPEPKQIGSYCGFDLFLSFDALSKSFRLTLKGALSHTAELGNDLFGNIQRIDNALHAMPERLENAKQTLADLEQQRQAAEKEVKQPFPQEQELNDKCARLAQLDAELNIDKGRGEPTETLEETDGGSLAIEEEPEETEKASISESLKALSVSQPYVHHGEKCTGMEER